MSPLQRPTVVAGGVVVAAYAWMASGLRPFTVPALVAVLGGGVAALAVGVRWPAGAATGRPGAAGAWGWALLAAALAAWELQSFVQHPRSQHPTLSSLTTEALQIHWRRAGALVGWLAGGVWLARR